MKEKTKAIIFWLSIPVLIVLLLLSCDARKDFKGYVVGKSKIFGHMCHSDHKVSKQERLNGKIRYQIIKAEAVPTIPIDHRHHYEKSRFILYVANIDEVNKIFVDSIKFEKTSILDRIYVNSIYSLNR